MSVANEVRRKYTLSYLQPPSRIIVPEAQVNPQRPRYLKFLQDLSTKSVVVGVVFAA